MTALSASYQACAQVSRQAASNFCWSFWLLPRPKRQAMFALYAFSRRSDDLTDDETIPLEHRRNALAGWRDDVRAALDEEEFRHPLLPALSDTVRRFEVPPRLLFDILDGVEMDLGHPEFADFDALRGYCRLVASSVGVACLHIWGFERSEPEALQSADACGIAFQLTNILRDLQEDARRGRIYLPGDELQRRPAAIEALRQERLNDDLRALIQEQIERAKDYYRQAEAVRRYVHHDGRRMLGVMMRTYRSLLDAIEARRGDVFSDRVRIGVCRRMEIVAREFLTPPEWTVKLRN